MPEQTYGIGIDIGGTGIKGAIVDLDAGTLVSDRVKHPTPKGGKPHDIVKTTSKVLSDLAEGAANNLNVSSLQIGICFPAVVRSGITMSAANISEDWIGLEAEKLFEDSLARPISFVNDADAAGLAESSFGAAQGVSGLTIMTTLGTGIGTALLYNGILVPNAELGHLEIGGHDIETRASNAAREREELDWEHWAKRLQKFYSRLEAYFSPNLFVVGGGVSKQHDEFLPLLDLKTPIVPAKNRNNAGILGAAALASTADRQLH